MVQSVWQNLINNGAVHFYVFIYKAVSIFSSIYKEVDINLYVLNYPIFINKHMHRKLEIILYKSL